MKKCLLTFVLPILTVSQVVAQAIFETEIPLMENEVWYGGAVGYGSRMPYKVSDGAMDLAVPTVGEHAVPLLLSSRGRYIRSDKPLRFEIRDNSIVVRSNYGIMEPVIAGRTLRDAYLAACSKHFPPQGRVPHRSIFTMPVYDVGKCPAGHTQNDILGYAESIVKAGLPPGIIVIDDRWQDRYGSLTFSRRGFDDPAAMVAKLHQMGFKVMLWVSPFVSADSPEYRNLREMGYLLRVKSADHAAIVRWSNGQSACLDMTNPDVGVWLSGELERLQTEYGIDGFRFDCDAAYEKMGEMRGYDKDAVAADHLSAWSRMASGFPLHDLVSSWNMCGQPVVLMLGDRVGVQDALTSSVAAGLLGCSFTGPSMDVAAGDRKILLRSVQLNALMPVMHIPAGAITAIGSERMKDIMALRTKMLPYIMECVDASAQTGEPVIRHMEYSFPGEGFADCLDQFMIGDKYMVAPVLDADDHRDVKLPKGRWRDDAGQVYRGGTSISLKVPTERILCFEKL